MQTSGCEKKIEDWLSQRGYSDISGLVQTVVHFQATLIPKCSQTNATLVFVNT